MYNEDFALLSEENRQAKLRDALRHKTCNCLTDQELWDILISTPLKRQYKISVYFNEDTFRNKLALPSDMHGRTILGQVMAGTRDNPGDLYCTERAAAILTRQVAKPEGINEIHIYVPPVRLEKRSSCI